MSALKIFVVVAVVLCVHALMVEAERNGRKQQGHPRKQQQAGHPQRSGPGKRPRSRPQGKPHPPQQGHGGPKRKGAAKPKPRKGQRGNRRPRPPPQQRPRNGAPRLAHPASRPDPETIREMQCTRLMMVKNTKEQIAQCQKETPKPAGDTIEDHREDVYMCLQKLHGVMNDNGEPIVEAIQKHIDDEERLKDQQLKDDLKAKVAVCAKQVAGGATPKETANNFRDCIIQFCKGNDGEEEEEEEQAAAE